MDRDSPESGPQGARGGDEIRPIDGAVTVDLFETAFARPTADRGSPPSSTSRSPEDPGKERRAAPRSVPDRDPDLPDTEGGTDVADRVRTSDLKVGNTPSIAVRRIHTNDHGGESTIIAAADVRLHSCGDRPLRETSVDDSIRRDDGGCRPDWTWPSTRRA
ncbi:MAG: hypothetical protein CMJ23_02570 [Phycisphaerae bacterium]|nr:hypothetical protein [Phycisphaerae bacterium]